MSFARLVAVSLRGWVRMSRLCVDCGGSATRELASEFPVCRPCWASWLARFAKGVL